MRSQNRFKREVLKVLLENDKLDVVDHVEQEVIQTTHKDTSRLRMRRVRKTR
jgi:hypothetical protein